MARYVNHYFFSMGGGEEFRFESRRTRPQNPHFFGPGVKESGKKRKDMDEGNGKTTMITDVRIL